jgi:hypothetical protein
MRTLKLIWDLDLVLRSLTRSLKLVLRSWLRDLNLVFEVLNKVLNRIFETGLRSWTRSLKLVCGLEWDLDIIFEILICSLECNFVIILKYLHMILKSFRRYEMWFWNHFKLWNVILSIILKYELQFCQWFWVIKGHFEICFFLLNLIPSWSCFEVLNVTLKSFCTSSSIRSWNLVLRF